MPPANYLFSTPPPPNPKPKVPSMESITPRKTKPAWAGESRKGHCYVEVRTIQQVIRNLGWTTQSRQSRKSNISSFIWFHLHTY